jgi:hypothetical protein
MIRALHRVVPVVPLLAALLVAGCAQKLGRPSPSPSGDAAPVTLRNLQIESIDGHRAVLMRLSRLPTMIRHSSSRRPPEITVQAWGPVGDGDLPERVLPQIDALVSQVRVSRHEGGLTIVLDLHGDQPPPYSVHQMADWIMVRFSAPES